MRRVHQSLCRSLPLMSVALMLLAVPQESTAALSGKPAQLTAPLPRHLASPPRLLEASRFVFR